MAKNNVTLWREMYNKKVKTFKRNYFIQPIFHEKRIYKLHTRENWIYGKSHKFNINQKESLSKKGKKLKAKSNTEKEAQSIYLLIGNKNN